MDELLEFLRCPETHQRLVVAESELVSRLNADIEGGRVKNRAGKAVSKPIDSGLVREDRKFLYPVRRRIPELLIDEAIPL